MVKQTKNSDENYIIKSGYNLFVWQIAFTYGFDIGWPSKEKPKRKTFVIKNKFGSESVCECPYVCSHMRQNEITLIAVGQITDDVVVCVINKIGAKKNVCHNVANIINVNDGNDTINWRHRDKLTSVDSRSLCRVFSLWKWWSMSGDIVWWWWKRSTNYIPNYRFNWA